MGLIERLLAQGPVVPEPHGSWHHDILGKQSFEAFLRMTRSKDRRGRLSFPSSFRLRRYSFTVAADIYIGRPLDRNKLRPLRRAAFNLSICNLQSSSGRYKARSGIGIPSYIHRLSPDSSLSPVQAHPLWQAKPRGRPSPVGGEALRRPPGLNTPQVGDGHPLPQSPAFPSQQPLPCGRRSPSPTLRSFSFTPSGRYSHRPHQRHPFDPSTCNLQSAICNL